MPRPKPLPTTDALASWRAQAACADPDAGMEDAWIAEDRSRETRARAICHGCEVRYQCLLDAMTDEEAEGIRAGFHFDTGTLNTADRLKLRNEFGFNARAQRRRLNV